MATITTGPNTGVIVTGAASGIGRSCAELLAKSGRPVALWDIQAEKVEEAAAGIAKKYGVPTIADGFDIREHDHFGPAIDAARATIGPIGGLIHAAGVSHGFDIDEITETEWDFVQDIHLKAQTFLVKALLPDLRTNEGSAVVGISSINAIMGNEKVLSYSAAKAGVLGLTRSLADTLGKSNIRINAICPGYIRTPMMEGAFNAIDGLEDRFTEHTMLGRIGDPHEIAAAARFLLSDEASYMTGAHLVIDGGATISQH